ncbi:MAG: succinate dehydrogenase cytochrome b subunit [Actinomycetota bacterium]|nr:succinate dehydrogenase cytochrome b subunit [Actinomycetota bacterium]
MATSTTPRTSPTTTARRTTIAMKLVMAVTGLVFVAYVLLHMYGNLKMFNGQAAYDEYAEHLRTLLTPILPYSGLLWIIRVVLLASLVAHVYSAFYLWSRAQNARTTKNQVRKAAVATISSRFMRWGGVALLLFVVWHILQFTTQTINVNGSHASPYERYVSAFQPSVWWCFVIYAAAMVALFMHLRHGVWSASQTLGLTGSARSRRNSNLLAQTLAVVIAGGFILPAIFVLLGVIK